VDEFGLLPLCEFDFHAIQLIAPIPRRLEIGIVENTPTGLIGYPERQAAISPAACAEIHPKPIWRSWNELQIACRTADSIGCHTLRIRTGRH
jgi:hypothetical protein